MQIFKKSDEKKSEELFKELHELDKQREMLVVEKRKMLQDPALRDLFISVRLGAEILDPNDHLLQEFEDRLKISKIELRQKERVLAVQESVAMRELSNITAPVIRKAIEELDSRRPRAKVKRTVMDRRSGGISMEARLVVESNEPSIQKKQKLIRESIAAIEGMRLRPLREIQEKKEFLLKEIAELDDEKTETKEMGQFEYARREFLSPSSK